ncbi:hypothetical protein GBA52_013929 [Prunus armeniaca]|nr:hypothetical protein GBA52_013929 [Prunus armeniaca]
MNFCKNISMIPFPYAKNPMPRGKTHYMLTRYLLSPPFFLLLKRSHYLFIRQLAFHLKTRSFFSPIYKLPPHPPKLKRRKNVDELEQHLVTLSLKVVLISTGLVSMAVALKLSAPVVSDIVASQVPSLWSSALSWLRPPYLYILINCIIITIVASSKLHPRPEDSSPEMITVPAPVTR